VVIKFTSSFNYSSLTNFFHPPNLWLFQTFPTPHLKFEKINLAHVAHTLFNMAYFNSFQSSPAFPDHPPNYRPPRARQCFAWTVNLNVLVRIHFSCLGTITKQFLSTELESCANVRTDQAQNKMFWMTYRHNRHSNTCRDSDSRCERFTHSHLLFKKIKTTFSNAA